MASAKEIIAKLKQVFSEETEVKMQEARSADGAILNIEPALEKGAKVLVVSEEGKTPVADGELKLEDGTILICEGGVISEIKPAEEKKEDESAKGQAPNEMESKFTAEIGSLKELFESSLKTISERLDKIEAASKVSGQEMAAVKKFSNQLLEVVEKIADEPLTPPTEKPKQGFSSIREAKRSYQDELKRLRKA